MNNQEKDKRSVIKTDSENMFDKHKGTRSKYPNSESSSEVRPKSRRVIQRYVRDNSESDRKPRRKKYKPYKEISR